MKVIVSPDLACLVSWEYLKEEGTVRLAQKQWSPSLVGCFSSLPHSVNRLSSSVGLGGAWVVPYLGVLKQNPWVEWSFRHPWQEVHTCLLFLRRILLCNCMILLHIIRIKESLNF